MGKPVAAALEDCVATADTPPLSEPTAIVDPTEPREPFVLLARSQLPGVRGQCCIVAVRGGLSVGEGVALKAPD